MANKTMVHFSSLVVVFLLCVIAPSNATKVVKVDVICKKARDPSFCLALLNSKPGGVVGADLISLTQYTIDVVRANVTNSIKLIKTLLAQNGGNGKARDLYKECLDDFRDEDGALNDVDDIQEYLKSRDYRAINPSTLSLMEDVDYCVNKLDSPNQPPFPNTSKVQEYVDDINQVANVILTISDFLISN